ncbi:hypothetical protein ES705_11741 [subsurface metagenome]
MKTNNSKDDMVFTKKQQIETVKGEFRHVVILGAGASRASCIDNPEKNNKVIPLMDDITKIVDLNEELKGLPKELKKENFENMFSYLYEKKLNSGKLKIIEEKVYNYFDSLILPETTTIYDYLVLSLRRKDLIATFNWDPFLCQAYERNRQFTADLPQLAFLHGNVAIGFCEESNTFGSKHITLQETRKDLKPTKLLYPITRKNYNSDPFIKDQWDKLLYNLKSSPVRTTIFGYSAPVTDVEAILAMKEAWGCPKLAQFEIIDTKDRDTLKKSWKEFIFSHHYEIHSDFFKSTITLFPRRTGEVYEANKLYGKFYEENPVPRIKSLNKLWDWYSELIKHENNDTER